jgi:ketosteroid isomerase-like protein
MAHADVELVRSIYESFERHEWPGDRFADDITWTTWKELPDATTHRGRDAVRRFFADWVAAWAEVRNEPQELIDAGDRVVVLVHGSFRLAEGAVPFESDYAHVWTVRDGRAVSVEAVDRDAALALVQRR